MSDVEDRPKEEHGQEIRDDEGQLKSDFVSAVQAAVNLRDRDALNAALGL